jgi:hypothetical protein
MPDWYILRNDESSAYPYQVRLGGCEYSLTHEEWADLAIAFHLIDSGKAKCIESQDYQDLVYSRNAEKASLSSIMNLPKFNRRF